MGSPVTAGFWLSPQQKRTWTLQQEGRALRSVCLVQLDGNISEQSFAASLKQLSTRHEILRTICVHQPGMKFPFQAILDAAEPSVEFLDLTEVPEALQVAKLDELFQGAQVANVGPAHGPVFSATLVALGPNQHAVLLSLPAISADVASLQIIAKELAGLLRGDATENGEEPLRYVQFAQWQNDLIEGDDENSVKGKQFWEGVGEAPRLLLPNELKGAEGRSERVIARTLDTKLATQIETLAKRLNASESDLLLAAWQCVVWRLTHQSLFQVGIVFDGREYDELREAVGLIAKCLPIEARFDGDFCFLDVVEHVRGSMAKAAEWQEYYVPGFGFAADAPVCFEWLPGISDSSAASARIAVCNDSYKLKLSAQRRPDGLAIAFHYDALRIDDASVERLAGYFAKLLAGAVATPETQVSRLPLLGEGEFQRLVVEWNRTSAGYPDDKCFHQLFEAQAAATPDRPALRFNDEVISYGELNERANQLAHYLRSLGVGPDSLVGLCVERSAQTIVAVMGILKAGGAYVPLNPDNPKPRLVQQLAGAVALLTERKLLGQMPEFGGKTLCLDTDAALWASQPRGNPENRTTPENLVYVIYTSGSTGVPKGVAVRHRNLVNYSHYIRERLRVDDHPEGLHFATVSTIGADLGNTCIYPSLMSGGCLHVISYDVSTDAQRMAAYTERYPIDVLKIVPSHLQALLESPQGTQVLPKKYLAMGGETFTPALAEKIYACGGTCEVFNHYGPTETTVGSLTLRLAEFDWKNSQAASIPIGRPIANTQVYVLDSSLQPVPTGAVGELYIAGDGVTAGYLGQPEKTDERFVRNPFSTNPTNRMYRTGDLARFTSDGNVEFLGRDDDQVKVRGFRIELGEIESALTAKTGVKQAVVLAKENECGDKRLVAYVVADSSLNNTPDELRRYLKQQLPDFMVPSAVVLLTKIPLNANGKVDRQALPEPESVPALEFVAPKNAMEEGVAQVWQEVLRRERISTDENFFDLGGHSLMATQVISRIRDRFHVELPIRAIFQSPTIEGLAKSVTTAANSGAQTSEPAIVRVSRDAYRACKNG
jgi:amino acid adenylation domain-containing protein